MAIDIYQTYTIRALCANCLYEQHFNIPIGTSIEKYFVNNAIQCDHCKCAMGWKCYVAITDRGDANVTT